MLGSIKGPSNFRFYAKPPLLDPRERRFAFPPDSDPGILLESLWWTKDRGGNHELFLADVGQEEAQQLWGEEITDLKQNLIRSVVEIVARVDPTEMAVSFIANSDAPDCGDPECPTHGNHEIA